MNVIVGFIVILLLGFLTSRLALFRDSFTRGFPVLILAGTEYLLIGAFLGPRFAGILDAESLRQLSPVLSLGLGWIGLLIGMQFDRKITRQIGRPLWLTGLFASAAVFAAAFAAACWIQEWLLNPAGLSAVELDPIPEETHERYRLGFCLAAASCGVVSTYTVLALYKRGRDARGEAIRSLQLLSDLRSPMAILLMGSLYCVFHVSNWGVFENPAAGHPIAVAPGIEKPVELKDAGMLSQAVWVRPMMGGAWWLLLTVILGTSLGWLLHYLTSEKLRGSEMLLVLAGSVIFSSGLASSMHLSPLFVNFLMGLTLTNLPNFARGRVSNWLTEHEKPFFVVFMIITGAIWPHFSWNVLLAATVYCVARAAGLFAGVWLGFAIFWPDSKTPMRKLGAGMLPQGGLAIALALDHRLILPGHYADMALSLVVTAVLINQIVGPNLLFLLVKPGPMGRAGEPRRADAPAM